MSDEDLCQRVVALTDAMTEPYSQLEAITTERAAIVGLLRERGWTFGQIAKATGLSRSRVAQIASTNQAKEG